MASTGLITAEQLQTVVQAIMNKVLKVDSDGAPMVMATSLGDLQILYFRDTDELTFYDSISGKSAVLRVTHNGSDVSSKVATIVDNELEVETVYAGTLSEKKVAGANSSFYGLPRAFGAERNKALHPQTGGGLILTTRHRAYEPVVHTGHYNPSLPYVHNVEAHPYRYTIVQNAAEIDVTFADIVNEVNEYWFDINFPSGSTPVVTFGTFADDSEIVWTGEGEPDWSTLGGRRIQIHILAGMASYVISAEEGVSEEQ